MVSLKTFSIFYAILLAGYVASIHIKKDRFPNHRSQCRPRLTSSAEEVATVPAAVSTIHGHSPTSRTFISTSQYISSAIKSISSAISQSQSPVAPSMAITSTQYITSASQSISSVISHSTHSTTTPSTTTTSTSWNVISTSSTKDTVTTQVASPLSASLTPNNVKAGIAGGDAYPYMQDHIGWWYDWSPNPSKAGTPIAVPMLWGNGTANAQDAQRLTAFEHLATVPPYVLGFEEPDCPSGSGSAGMSVEDGVSKWESLIAPLRAKGAQLGSPSMCKQADETWLAQFKDEISTPWDFTAIHINKNSMDGVMKDIEHYMTYGKPIWVTEFACVNDSGQFTPCTDQGEINTFINEVVPYFESNPNVYGYAYSNGEGLGNVWPLMNGNSLSESGRTYLAAISQYY